MASWDVIPYKMKDHMHAV